MKKRRKLRGNYSYVIFIFIVTFFACDKNIILDNSNHTILYKKKKFALDEYYIHGLNDMSYKTESFINITNDTIFMLDQSYGYNKIWIIGLMSNIDSKAFSSNSELENSLIGISLKSKLRFVDTIGQEIIYDFDINLSSDLDGEFNKKIIFSKKNGLICLIENDTISMPPFW